MRSFQAISSLNSGVLSPKMGSRYDLAQYYKGLSVADNVLTQPQGGVVKRFGLEYIDDIDIGTLSDWTRRLIAFDEYILVLYSNGAGDLRVAVYQDGVKQANINGSGNDYFTITGWSDREFDYVISTDGIIMVNPLNAPILITSTSATTWTVTTITLDNIPQFDFDDASSPTPTSAVWTVALPAGQGGDTWRIQIDGIQSSAYPVETATAYTATNVQKACEEILNNFSGDITAVFDAAPAIYEITFAGGAAKDYDAVLAIPELTAAAPPASAATNTVVGVPRTEDVWSATRGWPGTVTFHENRLVFGGSPSRPQTIWMSRIGQYFDFRNFRSLDNEAINVTLETSSNSGIVNVYSDRHLCVFTESSEYYCPQIPVTPTNVAFPQQSEFGSIYGSNVVSLDNQVIFGQKGRSTTRSITGGTSDGGGAVRNFVFLNAEKAYTANSLSMLADNVVNFPDRMAAAPASQDSDSVYLYTVTGGSMAVLNTLQSEGVLAWTTFTTGESDNVTGIFIDVVTLGSDVYMIVDRQTGTTVDTNMTLVKIGSEYLDHYASGTQASSTTLTVPTRYDGSDAVIIDKVSGAVYEGLTISGGSVTLPDPITDWVVGYSYAPTLTTMPLNVTLQDGPHAGEPKRIVSVSSNLLDSQGVTVNGENLVFPETDDEIRSGRFDVRLSGWSVEAYVTMSQEGPYPFNPLDMIVEIDS